jgi:hypothetical protein
MNAIFNYESLSPVANDKYDAKNRLINYLDTLAEMRDVGFSKVNVSDKEKFKHEFIAKDYTINDFLRDKSVDGKYKGLLLFSLSVPHTHPNFNAECYEQTIEFLLENGEEAESFLVAHCSKYPNGDSPLVVSLESDEKWDNLFIRGTRTFIGISKKEEKEKIGIRNSTFPKHVRIPDFFKKSFNGIHKPWALILGSQTAKYPVYPRMDLLLPEVDNSNKLVKNNWKDTPDWSRFNSYKAKLSSNDKIACLRDMGELIALINRYEYDTNLSSINSTKYRIRDIYKSLGSKNIYLSVDIRHGDFEVLNSKGKHQGSIAFDGELIKAADSKGKHDIKLKK